MKNFISRLVVCGILAAGASFAAQINDLTVTLPHAVTVGSNTLPSGTYTISEMQMGAGDEYFVVRGQNMTPVVIPAMRAESTTADKTAITLAKESETWHLDKLSIAGESVAYEFGR